MPCTDPLANDECVVLLIRSDDICLSQSFLDSGAGPNCPHTITPFGLAFHDAGIKKFCASSLCFLSTGGLLQIPDHADFTSPADFAYDFHFRTTQSNLAFILGAGFGDDPGVMDIAINRVANKLTWYEGGAIRVQSASDINDDEWHHALICRDGTTLYLGLDGVIEDSLSAYNTVINGTHYRIGISHSGTLPFFGRIDEWRHSKGTYRWNANYSVPTAPYDYLCPPCNAWLSGTIKEKGAAVERTVRSYIRSTGELYQTSGSQGDGTFSVGAPDDTTEMFVIAFDDDAGIQYNSLIYDRVKAITP